MARGMYGNQSILLACNWLYIVSRLWKQDAETTCVVLRMEAW